MKFNTDNIGDFGSATLYLAGFLIIAMAIACRCREGLGKTWSFRKAAGQTVLSIFLSAVSYGILGFWTMIVMEGRGPDKGEIRFILMATIGLAVWQICLLALAVKNLFLSLNE